MPGPAIQWPPKPEEGQGFNLFQRMLPENASVTDSTLVKALRTINSLLGGNDPSSQVLGVLTTHVPGQGSTGGLLESLQKSPAIQKLVEKAKASITAYHGSPHDFEQFSLEKIGTGEGAQAYGHGLYFAENEATAKAYRDALAPPDLHVEYAGRRYHPQSQGMDAGQRHLLIQLDTVGKEQALKGARGWLGALEDSASTNPIAKYQIEDQKRLIDWFEKVDPSKVRVTNQGKMYEVSIAADPADFLDWDKPLSQQSEKVQQWVKDQGLRFPDSTKGSQIYDSLSSRALSSLPPELRPPTARGQLPTAATEQLKQAGIPGIKYLDQGSRNRGPWTVEFKTGQKIDFGTEAARTFADRARAEGSLLRYTEPTPATSNYVVFDDALIDIKKKWALLLGLAGAGGSQLQQVDEAGKQ